MEQRSACEDDMSEPGAFAKVSRSAHNHSSNCFHKYVVPAIEGRPRDACAAAQVLNALNCSMERVTDKGTLHTKLQQAKVTVSQFVISKEIATGEVRGLDTATASILGVTTAFVRFGADKRGSKSNEDMNRDLIAGKDTLRTVRSDKYDRRVPYNYFHHEGDGPDFCSLVEPNKSKRKQWQGKLFMLGDESIRLTCQPSSRRGTCAALAEDYRRSETALK